MALPSPTSISRMLSFAHLSESRMCQTVWHTYGLYLWYVSTFHVTFLSMTHHVRMYIRTYFVRIDP